MWERLKQMGHMLVTGGIKKEWIEVPFFSAITITEKFTQVSDISEN